ncbi:MAG: phosphatidylserine/phosphatidylglycerophosphate/cardiolipin synthase family protein [Anaeromyxobacteraceae bacterium]
MRLGRILLGAAASAVGVALSGHLARRVRRRQLSNRMLRRAEEIPIEVLLEREVGVPVRDGNAVDVLDDGRIFDALEREIREARQHIHINQFMWMGPGDPSDRIGRAILERRRGVTCRLVLDWFGSASWGEHRFDADLERRLVASGVELRRHAPLPDPFRLTHRRVLVFDGRVAYVGGFGIWRSWVPHEGEDGEGDPGWRDVSARVRGPVVADLQRAFDHSLQAAGGAPLRGDAYPRLRAEGDLRIAAVASTPAWARVTRAARMYYALIASARRRLWIANSYFVPERSLQNLLIAQARQGVDVRVLAPGPKHDQPLVRAGQRRTYDRLLRNGVHIHEYTASMMHAKTLVSDDVAVIGSTNMDSQSLSFLWETSVVVLSAQVAEALAARFSRDLERAREMELGRWRRRPAAMRAQEVVAGLTEPWT